MKNRFNRLSSKEWLPFQKSWFRATDKMKLYRENIRFFIPQPDQESHLFYQGKHEHIVQKISVEEGFTFDQTGMHDCYDFVLVDLLDDITSTTSTAEYEQLKTVIISTLENIFDQLTHRRFVCVLMPNGQSFVPFAWDLALHISSIYTLKDEKIGCVQSDDALMGEDIFYALYFRKDESSSGRYLNQAIEWKVFDRLAKQQTEYPAWFVLKPQPRKKNEILHPAKYPEELVSMFLTEFTKEGDVVFDPMSGTGSTQLAALKHNRNAYGTELSDFFASIAHERCQCFVATSGNHHQVTFRIVNADARSADKLNFPPFDYIMTSPPYWDMLNMKGAENQAKRLERGLMTNYSEDQEDLGNVADYQQFMGQLLEIYFKLIDQLKPGGFMTIVVKNIKKKGKNYPFAWQLALALQSKLIRLPENFWCQDDINLAPYGYGNTWVSNTFHQYCLHFQKPKL